jgi:hypothetical protein
MAPCKCLHTKQWNTAIVEHDETTLNKSYLAVLLAILRAKTFDTSINKVLPAHHPRDQEPSCIRTPRAHALLFHVLSVSQELHDNEIVCGGLLGDEGWPTKYNAKHNYRMPP